MKFENFFRLGLATLVIIAPTTLYVATHIMTNYVTNHALHTLVEHPTDNQAHLNATDYEIGSIKDKRESFKLTQSNDERNYFRLK